MDAWASNAPNRLKPLRSPQICSVLCGIDAVVSELYLQGLESEGSHARGPSWYLYASKIDKAFQAVDLLRL